MKKNQVLGDHLVQAIDYHLIKRGKQNLLFNVERLKVYSTQEIDQKILKLAQKPISINRLISSLNRFDQEVAHSHIARLVDDCLLYKSLNRPGKVPLVAPSDYVTFMINVAQCCNLTCTYCYVNYGHFDYSEPPVAYMSSSDAEDLVEHIHRIFPYQRVYGYHFYGGEPLLNFDAIRTIVNRALMKSDANGTAADFHITTNGTLVTEKIADFLDCNRFKVYYSIDSDKQIHNSIRRYRNGEGSFNDVERNLDILRNRNGIHLILSSVVHDNNHLSSAIKKLTVLGAHQCKAERIHLKDEDPLALVGQNHDAYIRDIESLVSHYIEYLERYEKPLDFRLSSKILQLLTCKRRNFFCPAGERMFGIAANGEIYPCSLHVGRHESKLGSVMNGIDQDAVKQFRFRFSASGQERCQHCWNRTLCGGGCSAMVDRFGHEQCDILCAESEAAIQIYHYFAKRDSTQLLALVSPNISRWINGIVNDPKKLIPSEPAAELAR